MTKKHFIAIAAIVADIRDRDERVRTANALGFAFKQANPRFCMARFLTACNAF